MNKQKSVADKCADKLFCHKGWVPTGEIRTIRDERGDYLTQEAVKEKVVHPGFRQLCRECLVDGTTEQFTNHFSLMGLWASVAELLAVTSIIALLFFHSR